MLWWISLSPLKCLQVVFSGERFCSFHWYSSLLVWCLDSLSSNRTYFLVSYRFWTNQFLLSCVSQKKCLNMTAFFYATMVSLLQIHLWQIFTGASFLIFIARIWSRVHVSSLPSLLLWLPRAWWCFHNLVLCVHNGTESFCTFSRDKCWTDLATCLVGDL